MAPRFSRPRLIDANDAQYRAFVRQIMIGKDNQRATRPPLPRELFGGEAEAALRDWLAQRYTLSDRRIVEYLEHRGRSAIKKYRELDAVVLSEQKWIEVFEIKASQKAASVRRAAQQLNDTRAILGMLFRRVQTTILLVDTGIPTAADVAELMAGEDPPAVPPPTLDEVLAVLPRVHLATSLDARDPDPEIVNLIRFSVEDIIALAGAENLHLNWDEEDEADPEAVEQPEEPAVPSYAYTTDEPAAGDDDDNPLAAALRKAMQAQGRDTSKR
ncbi:MAG TPA: hypothetical protein VKE41_02365 [Roseiflexaceae bacterium]|nr:hypothetical protein [Roseiflexaceae bacterium]